MAFGFFVNFWVSLLVLIYVKLWIHICGFQFGLQMIRIYVSDRIYEGTDEQNIAQESPSVKTSVFCQ